MAERGLYFNYIIAIVLVWSESAAAGNQQLKVISISVGNASDTGNPPVISSISVALDIIGQRYPQLYDNYTYHAEALQGGNGCADGMTNGDNAEIGLSNLYRDGHFFNNGPTIIIASTCVKTFQSVANYAGEVDILALGFSTADSTFEDKNRFPTLLTFSTATPTIYASKLMAVMDMFRWQSIAVIFDKCSAHAKTGYSMRVKRECQGVTGLLQNKKNIKFVQIDTDSNGPDADWAAKALWQASNFSRIILACTLGPAQSQIALTASDLGMMNGQYVFIHLYETEVPQEYPLSCRTPDGKYNKKLCTAFGHYLMVRSDPLDWDKLSDYTDKAKTYWNTWFQTPTQTGILGSEFMAVVFEALESITQVLEELRQRNDSSNFSGRKFTQLMLSRIFNLTSRTVKMTKVGSRVVTTHIQVFSRRTRDFQSIFVSDSTSSNLTRMAGVEFPWGTKDPPLDRPLCGIQNEFCLPDDTSFLLSTSLGVVLPVVGILAIIVFFERRRRLSHAYEKWLIDPRIQYTGASVNDHNSSTSAIQLLTGGKRTMEVRGIRAVCCVPGRDEAMEKAVGGIGGSSPKSQVAWFCNHLDSFAELSRLLTRVTDLRHPNINDLLGISLYTYPPYICQIHRERGSLVDLLHAGNASVDWNLKTSLISDLVEGLCAIHHSVLKLHGNLKPSKCVVDGRFCLRIDDLAHEEIMSLMLGTKLDTSLTSYSAPEMYEGMPLTPASDVFSFALIASRLLTDSPLTDARMRSRASTIVAADHIKHAQQRTNLDFHETNAMNGCKEILETVLRDCLQREFVLRPTMVSVRAQLRRVMGKTNLLDSLLHRLRNHTDTLEIMVFNRQQELLLEQRRCDELLNEMLPKEIVHSLRTGNQVQPESFESVTIYFSYISAFAGFVANSHPLEVVKFLDTLYSRFDQKLTGHQAYKIEAIGDSYMVASGLPIRNGIHHAREICALSFELQDAFESLASQSAYSIQMALQAGAHSGPVEAGIVGNKRPRYCLFGDTVNTASRMSSSSAAGKMHLSPQTSQLAQFYGFDVQDRGVVHIKGKGDIRTYWLLPWPSVKLC